MIFKKQISIFLAFFVWISNTGLAFNVHYCQDKIASITSVFSKQECCTTPSKGSNCCAKFDTNHEKCCSDKEINLKNNAEKEVVKSIIPDFVPLLLCQNDAHFLIFPSVVTLPQKAELYCFEANAPPLYQLYCQLTFYA
jgi:hypothetical protein